MPSVDQTHSVDDLRALARRRLPRPIFDYLDGGADEEWSLARNVAATQVEYRFPVKGRLGMVAFTGVGDVFDKTADLELDKLKYTIGTGLRFALNPEEKINIRVDAGYGSEGINFFVVLGEAF